MKYNEKIVALRKANGFTQEGFARAVGVTRQAVYKWEVGDSYPEAEKLLAIKRLFGISIDDLLDDSFDVVVERAKKSARKKTLPPVVAPAAAAPVAPVVEEASAVAAPAPAVEEAPAAPVALVVEESPVAEPVPAAAPAPVAPAASAAPAAAAPAAPAPATAEDDLDEFGFEAVEQKGAGEGNLFDVFIPRR